MGYTSGPASIGCTMGIAEFDDVSIVRNDQAQLALVLCFMGPDSKIP